MEENKIGFIPGVECKFVKTEPEKIDLIVKRTSISHNEVKFMMRYNIFTINQFALLAKLPVSSVINKTRPSQKDGKIYTALDYCHPFTDFENDGPKFIFRNEKSEKYLFRDETRNEE